MKPKPFRQCSHPRLVWSWANLHESLITFNLWDASRRLAFIPCQRMVEAQPTFNRDVRSMLMPHTYKLQRSFIPYRPSLLEPALIFRISLFVFFEIFFSHIYITRKLRQLTHLRLSWSKKKNSPWFTRLRKFAIFQCEVVGVESTNGHPTAYFRFLNPSNRKLRSMILFIQQPVSNDLHFSASRMLIQPIYISRKWFQVIFEL